MPYEGFTVLLEVRSLVRQMGLSKKEFAERMGISKQNVNLVFKTKNILTLRKAAQVLDVPLETLIADATEQEEITINGYVEVNRELYRVRDKEELLRVLQVVEELEAKSAQVEEYQHNIEY